MRGEGIGVRLILNKRSYDNAIPAQNQAWEVNSYSEEIKFMLTPIKGRLIMDAPWDRDRCSRVIADFVPDDSGRFECALEDYTVIWKKRDYKQSFDDYYKKVNEDYENWLSETPLVSEINEDARCLAAYITWSCVVHPKGKLTRPAMYMSKNWMTNIWSWDNCFNAMGLVKSKPELAWDQIFLFIDNQDDSGMFPDFINDKFASWSCCKPPIHGWAISWMMKRTNYITKEKIEEVYEPLCRWTKWWFEYRDDDQDGIPQYNHGNEAGWDNSTIFRNGAPIESPDLAAFLIVQMDTLSEMAQMLERNEEAAMWKSRADKTLDKMIKHFWNIDKFIACKSGTHDILDSESLILYIPIILGRRLPENIISCLVNGIKQENRFLTEYGLATESISSKYYNPDGYWRGPIWAPSTMIIIDGLIKVGEESLARDIAQRFCKMVRMSGMAENFDALTGKGLRDRAFTWTSSVFLILSDKYFEY